MADKAPRIIPGLALVESVGNQVLVRSKWGQSFVGTLVSVDEYMNVLLKDAEVQDPSELMQVKEILIRCNNVLYIRQVPVGVDLRKGVEA